MQLHNNWEDDSVCVRFLKLDNQRRKPDLSPQWVCVREETMANIQLKLPIKRPRERSSI